MTLDTTEKTSLERAFEIARTGMFRKVELLRRQLTREGFDRRQVNGRSLSNQLMAESRKARDKKPE
jgi:hypothetical protein